MSRARKAILALTLLAFIVVVALAAVVLILPDTDLIRVKAQNELSKMTGQNVTIGALEVSPSLSGIVHMKAKEVSVKGPDNERLFSADEVSFSPSIIPLLNKEISVESIRISSFRISVWRSKDGRLRLPEFPGSAAPAAKPAPLKDTPDKSLPQETQRSTVTESAAQAAHGTRAPAFPTDQLSWSIDRIDLNGGRLDWVDLHVWPGKQTLISLKDIEGIVRQTRRGQYNLDLEGEIRSGGRACGEFQARGDAVLDKDLKKLSTLKMEIMAPQVKLEPFKGYIPPKASVLKEFTEAKIKSTLSWQGPESAQIDFNAELQGEGEKPPRLDLVGKALINTVYWGIEKITISAESDFLPLKLLRREIPRNLPIDPLLGVVKGSVDLDYPSKDNWKAKAAISLENAVFAPPLRSLAKKARIWSQLKINPLKIDIDNLEISSGRQMARLKGTVRGPFSSRPSFDVTGKITPDVQWFKALSIGAPPDLYINGPFPVSGRVRGTQRELWLDLTGDLTRAGITYGSVLVKDNESPGSLSLKGKFVPGASSKSGKPFLDALVKLGLSNAGIRFSENGKWLKSTDIQAGAKLALAGGGLNLRDGVLKARQTGEPGDLVSVKMVAREILSPEPIIKGKIQATLDRRIPMAAGANLSESFKMTGSGVLTGSFSKQNAGWKWSALLPLKHLDITVADFVRKPVGIDGTLKANGRWGSRGLIIDKGALELPGAPIRISGLILDEQSRFSGIDIHAPRIDLKSVRAFVPALASAPLSGPIEAALSVNADNKGRIEPSGVIRLLSVSYTPGPAAWRLADTRGRIVLKGYDVDFPDIRGKIQGAAQGPAKISGSLSDITSVKTVNGKVKARVGPGSLAVKSVVSIVAGAKRFIDALMGERSGSPDKKSNHLTFETLEGDFDIKYGKATSDNVRLRGGDIKAGAIGAIDLESSKVEAVAGFYTEVRGIGGIGEIPAVKEQLKKYSGILKATGLSKELERFGIKTPETNAPDQPPQGAKPTPITVLLRIYGPVSDPNTTPVLERALPNKVVGKLKAIMK